MGIMNYNRKDNLKTVILNTDEVINITDNYVIGSQVMTVWRDTYINDRDKWG